MQAAQTLGVRHSLRNLVGFLVRRSEPDGLLRVKGGMQRLLLVVLILAFGITSADARRRKHRLYVYEPHAYVDPRDAATMARRGQFRDPRSRSAVTMPGSDEPGQRSYTSVADLVPPGWQPQPADPDRKGQRFQSPDGTAWFAVYAGPAERNAMAAQMKAVAFADGEELTYLRGERTWIAASGLRGDAIFYRKAVLACAGDRWHHIAFEYPAAMKKKMEPFVNRASEAVHHSQNLGCDTPVSHR
jgi:hypothetical protein